MLAGTLRALHAPVSVEGHRGNVAVVGAYAPATVSRPTGTGLGSIGSPLSREGSRRVGTGPPPLSVQGLA